MCFLTIGHLQHHISYLAILNLLSSSCLPVATAFDIRPLIVAFTPSMRNIKFILYVQKSII